MPAQNRKHARSRNKMVSIPCLTGNADPSWEEAALSRKYNHNFLKNVLVKVDFAAPIGLGAQGPPKSVIESLKKAFPVPEIKKIKVTQLISTPQGTQRTEHTQSQWFYHSKERTHRLCIDDVSMYVEYDKYLSFEQLLNAFMAVAKALFQSFENLQIKRLGVRYIDNIELPGPNCTEWKKYLDDKLLAAFGLAGDTKTITRAFHVLEQRWGDDLQCRFQYGMPNPDYPSTIRKKSFVLDWDVYCMRLIDAVELQPLLDKFHRIAKLGFEAVIKDALRKEMGIKRGR